MLAPVPADPDLVVVVVAELKPLALSIGGPLPGGITLTHWRCPYSPQCTRGTIRHRDPAGFLAMVEDWHRMQHSRLEEKRR